MQGDNRATGRFIVLDGIDGCGKSTQAELLVRRLRAEGRAVEHLVEPGSTRVGTTVRALVLDPEAAMSAGVEALLFAAARRALLEQAVLPALERGAVIVCERFHASTFAYQAVGGALDGDSVLALLHSWAGTPAPDLELVLLLDPVEARARRAGLAEDRIEARGLAFQERVDTGYQTYAERAPHARVVQAGGSRVEVEERIWEEVRRVL